MPIASANTTNKGTMSVVANIRVTTRYLKGLIADTSIASICSVTFIEPNSAPMLDPTLPAQIKAVTKEANARRIAIEISDGNQDVAPNVSNEGRDCFVNTIPVINPVKATNGNDLYPTW